MVHRMRWGGLGASLLGLAGAGVACSTSSDRVDIRAAQSGPEGLGNDSAGASDAGAPGGGAALRTTQPACEQVSLLDFVPEAARFVPRSGVSLRAGLTALDPEPCSTTLELQVTHVGEVVLRQTQQVAVVPGIEQTVVLRFDPPNEDFRGYMALLSSPGSSEQLSTGVDVSSTPYVFPRYGYISQFPAKQLPARSREIVSVLAEQYHINLFQLYDWFWRHEDLIPRDPDGEVRNTWVDLFGRVNSSATLEDVIEGIHLENGAALAYVAMYAARENYQTLSNVSPEWGLYQSPAIKDQVSLAFGGERYLFLFDPANPAWQAYMASEYVEAIDTFGFDGVQIDQFGPRATLYRASGEPVELRDTYVPFLEAIDAALEKNDPSRSACVFNLVDGAVDGYAVQEVATSGACDTLYSEIWFATDTYEEIRAYIEQLRLLSGGRAVVLALYAQYGQDVGTIIQAENGLLDGVSVATDHPGFTGTGFVSEFDAVGDSVTWEIGFERDPLVTFVLRYANATGQVATRTLVVDGEAVGKLTFPSRDSWNEWSFDAWLQQYVGEGEHEIQLLYAPDDVGVVNIDRLNLSAFDEPSVLLQNAVVFASGATPIQIGDDLQSLAHEYFPNRSKTLRPSLREALRDQYSFITAHETLFFAPDVTPIYERLDRISAVSEGHRLIAEGSGGIWSLLRRAPAGDVIHLVNLVGVQNAFWRDPAAPPTVQERISLRYRVEDPSSVREVLWATPDLPPSTFNPLAFTIGDGYVEFQVPRLGYWDVVLIRY